MVQINMDIFNILKLPKHISKINLAEIPKVKIVPKNFVRQKMHNLRHKRFAEFFFGDLHIIL